MSEDFQEFALRVRAALSEATGQPLPDIFDTSTDNSLAVFIPEGVSLSPEQFAVFLELIGASSEVQTDLSDQIQMIKESNGKANCSQCGIPHSEAMLLTIIDGKFMCQSCTGLEDIDL